MKRSIKITAVAFTLFAAAGLATAQNTPTSPSGTGSVSSDQEVRRGVPGVDADVGTKDRGANSGMPGVDVDVRNTRTQSGDPDTRRVGAGPRSEDTRRGARADRN